MDPNYIGPTEYEYYKQSHPPRYSDYSKRTQEQLIHDVNVAHDNLKRQVRINDKLVQQIDWLIGQLKRERTWRKWLMTAMGLTWAVIWWLLKFTAPLIVKGLAK